MMTNATLTRLLGCAAALAALSLFSTSASAQTAPAAPKPSPLRGSLSLGAGLANGAQAQRQYGIDFDLERDLTKEGKLAARFSRDYQRVTFPHDSLLNNRTAISGGAELHPGKNQLLMLQSMFLKDELLEVDSRFELLAGYGRRFAKADGTFRIEIVPGLSFYKEDLTFNDDKGWKSGYGFFERMSARINKTWSVQNEFRIRKQFSTDNRSIESSATARAAMTKTISLELDYQYNHESTVPDGFPTYLSILRVGLNVRF